jgi:hypothetical protein
MKRLRRRYDVTKQRIVIWDGTIIFFIYFIRNLQSALFVLLINESDKEITPEADKHGVNKVVTRW